MKLLQIGFLFMTLSALVGVVFSQQIGFPGGLGGFSGIFGLLILIVFIAVISKRPQCPSNYTAISPESSTCIRAFTTEIPFADARTACQTDGGDLVGLDTLTFEMVRAFADVNKSAGPCDFWVGATEAASGVWTGLISKPISTLGGLFFQNAGDFEDYVANECGKLEDSKDYYL
ncbi:hypothetical protein ACJMK2_008286 [Sinanodonta woodiana]|uniref:C-type lectin domain-containing protein n=1 Tax=Sinanodonta woodiana TaxID=1069815 RepID=A0ABD3VL45_SINWO